MYQRKMNPLEAARVIDKQLGGITGVIVREGITLQNHTKRLSLQRAGLSKKEQKLLEECAVLLYAIAQQNGSHTPGEVHLEKGLSSKHYASAFRDYIQKLFTKYNAN